MTVDELLMIFRTEPHTTKRRVLVAELDNVKRGVRLITPPEGYSAAVFFGFDSGKYHTVEEFIETLHLVERTTTVLVFDNGVVYHVMDVKVYSQQYYTLILERYETPRNS